MKHEDPLSSEELELSALFQDSELPHLPQKDSHVFLREIQEHVSQPRARFSLSFALGVPAFGAACLVLFTLSPKTNLPAESSVPTEHVAITSPNLQTDSMRQLAASSLEALEEETFGLPSGQQELATLHEVMQGWSWDQDGDPEDEGNAAGSNTMALQDSINLAPSAERLSNLEWEDGSFSDGVYPESLDDSALLALRDVLVARLN